MTPIVIRVTRRRIGKDTVEYHIELVRRDATPPEPSTVALSGRVSRVGKPTARAGLSAERKPGPIRPAEKEAIKRFLKKHKHPNRDVALIAVRANFPGCPVNIKLIAELRADAGVRGVAGPRPG